MTTPWWQDLVAPVSTLLAVIITMAFSAKTQARALRSESDEAALARAEAAEREDRRRFMSERRDAYIQFASAVDAWILEAQVVQYLPVGDPDRADAEERRLQSGLRVREALNHMSLISPLHVLISAGRVNSAARDDDDDPVDTVQPLLLEFIFECRRDLIGEAFWPRDLVDDDETRPTINLQKDDPQSGSAATGTR